MVSDWLYRYETYQISGTRTHVMDPRMLKLTPEEFFGTTTKKARQLAAAEKSGKVPDTNEFDFSVQQVKNLLWSQCGV